MSPATATGFTVLIPARMASSRLPDKPLADIAGLPMVVHVARRAAQSAATRVVVAADDPRILQACQAHGVQALLTRTAHAAWFARALGSEVRVYHAVVFADKARPAVADTFFAGLELR